MQSRALSRKRATNPTISGPLVSLLFLGCSAQYDIRVAFEDSATRARAAQVEVSLIEICSVQTPGASPASPVHRVAFSIDESSPALGDFDAGSYGLYARASDAECNVVAAGCTPVVLGSRDSGSLQVVLSEVDTPLCDPSERCVAGRCVGAADDGGVEDISTSDAGVEDATPGDGGADASVADGGAEDAGPTRTYCEQLGSDWGYRYCRDFDSDEPFLFGWDARMVEEGATLMADSNAFSTPSAFLATVTDPEDGSCVSAYSEVNVSGRASGTALRFQLRLGSMDETESFVGGYMRLRFMDAEGAEQCSLVMYSDDALGGVVEHVDGVAVDHPFTVRFPQPFDWTRIDLNVNNEAQTFDVSVDRETVFSADQTLSPSCAPTGDVVVSLGVQCGAGIPVGSGEVRLDDVTM